MPLITELLDEEGKTVPMGWGWIDRITLCHWVLLDGGTVGEADTWEGRGLLEMGYFGAGCDHVFTDHYAYRAVELKNGVYVPLSAVEVRPGMRYHEYRA